MEGLSFTAGGPTASQPLGPDRPLLFRSESGSVSYEVLAKVYQLDDKTYQLDDKTYQLDDKTYQLDDKTYQLNDKRGDLRSWQNLDQGAIEDAGRWASFSLSGPG